MTREEQIERMEGAEARSSEYFARALNGWPATDAAPAPTPKAPDAPVQVRIVSDGTVRGTKVYTESGERIRGVGQIVWSAVAGQDWPVAEITIGLTKVDMVGRAVMLAPDGRRISRIEYEDGTVEDYGIRRRPTVTLTNDDGSTEEIEV